MRCTTQLPRTGLDGGTHPTLVTGRESMIRILLFCHASNNTMSYIHAGSTPEVDEKAEAVRKQ